MESVKLLIDKAVKIVGSDQALAEKMGIARPNISLMRAGKRPISPATAAELADIAGEDARQATIDAVIESAKGTRREGVLREILGKGLAAGVAVMLVFSYSGDSKNDTEKIAKNDKPINSLYIVSSEFPFSGMVVYQALHGRFGYADRARALRVEPVTGLKTVANVFVRALGL